MFKYLQILVNLIQAYSYYMRIVKKQPKTTDHNANFMEIHVENENHT